MYAHTQDEASLSETAAAAAAIDGPRTTAATKATSDDDEDAVDDGDDESDEEAEGQDQGQEEEEEEEEEAKPALDESIQAQVALREHERAALQEELVAASQLVDLGIVRSTTHSLV